MGSVSRERSLQKITILVVDDSLENCRRFASNNDVVFPCLRVRSSNCAKKARMAQPIWLKLDEIAGTLGRIYGAVVLLNVSNWNRRAPDCICQKWVQSRRFDDVQGFSEQHSLRRTKATLIYRRTDISASKWMMLWQ